MTAITNILANGAPREKAQGLAGHADARTTDLYDRRSRSVTSETAETIAIGRGRLAQP